MTEFTRSPDPLGAPIDKIFTESNLEQLKWKLQGLLSEQPTKEEVIKAVLAEHENMTHYMDRHNRVLEGWANTHRHTTLIEGGPTALIIGSNLAIMHSNSPYLTARFEVDGSTKSDYPALSGSHWDVQVSPDKKRIVHTQDLIQVIKLETGDIETGWPTIAAGSSRRRIRFSPDGTKFALGYSESGEHYSVMDVATKTRIKGGVELPAPPSGSIVCNALAWSPDNKYLAVGFEGGTSSDRLRIIDLDTNMNITVPFMSEHVRCLDWSLSGGLLAIGQVSGALEFWDVSDINAVAISTGWPSILGTFLDVHFNASATKLAFARDGHNPRVLDIASKTEETDWPGVIGSVFACKWSPDETAVVFGHNDGAYYSVIGADDKTAQSGWFTIPGTAVGFAWMP